MSNSKTNPPVYFHYTDKPFFFKERARCKKSISDLFKREKVKLKEIHYIFCSDSSLLTINRKFLNHNYYTDIITFPLSEQGSPVTGEVYISIDRVKENAKTFNTSFSNELLRVIFHGALHLCGYKDKTKKQKEVMSQMEDKSLRSFQK
ncbi:MAG: rRNA maturation RNase YbeY [Bacteroidetes bacterium]|nr:rRNA maturation RNase YbeY [Bacteroidota bacterium]